ncbi:hypothetical protein [Enterovibrio norvegicus]|uniref:hypothetical protein n=1 Tax=Enterovibrio norvegicus TaxID=188144 RepID=UPI000C8594AB|nr:hypothetical protein [Enterovibrio norvegicus]PMN73158.1 hypothetical protein BCT27_12500 [Enterovibrio norvegicus]
MRDDDFTRIHAAQTAVFAAAMPQSFQVSDYAPEMLTGHTAIQTPSILLEVVAVKPGEKRSGGRLALNVEFCAHCILSLKTANVQMEVRNVAARVLQVVDLNRWGLDNAEQPRQLSAFPGMFSEKLGFESWVVSWEQDFHLGDVDLGDDWLPAEVYLGEAPNIGAAHIDNYEKISP